MSVVAVIGGPGAPGATATALGLTLTWPVSEHGRVVLVEADPDGGAVLSGALRSRVPATYGLHQLGRAHRNNELSDFFFRQLVDLSDGARTRLLVPGLIDDSQAPTMAHAWEPLAQLLAGLDQQPIPHDVVVDLGRRGAQGSSGVLARRADVVLLVVRANLRSIAAAHHRVPRLRDDLADHGTGADSLALVVIEDRDYKPSQISDLFGLPVLAVLPSDPRIGGALTDGTRPMDERAMKSPLMRRLATCAEQALILARTRAVRLRAPRAEPPREATRVG